MYIVVTQDIEGIVGHIMIKAPLTIKGQAPTDSGTSPKCNDLFLNDNIPLSAFPAFPKICS